MATPLSQQHCKACEGGVLALAPSETTNLLAQLDDPWTVQGTHLRREVPFADFRSAFSFATSCALLAEAEGHHPDLTVGWGRTIIDLTTHAARGLTENDFILAAKIDSLLRSS